jgi:hypothetical protein
VAVCVAVLMLFFSLPPPPRSYVLDTDAERVEDHDGDGTLETVAAMRWALADTTGDPPRPRKGHAAALVFSKLYVFGGVAGDRGRLNDLHVLDTETLVA